MMLSDDEVLDGLRAVGTPDECYFNVWQDGTADGERTWILPFYFYDEKFSILIADASIRGLESAAHVTVAVDNAIETLIEKLQLKIEKALVLRRSQN